MPRTACLLLVLSGAAGAQQHLNTLWPPRGRMEEQFGAAVDCDGRRMVVSALRVHSPGVLFVYRREGVNWIEEARLAHVSAASFGGFDGFGWTLEISGDRVAASARFGAGELHVFEQQPDGNWTRTTLLAPDPVNELSFSNTIQLDGDTLVATTFSGGGGADAVYVFDSIGGVWVQTAKLANLHVRDARLSGDSLVLSTAPPDAGVRFYERAGTDWNLTGTIATASAPFLARDGDVLAVVGTETAFYEHVGPDWLARGTLAAASNSVGLDGSRYHVRRSGNASRPLTVEVYARDAAWNWTPASTIFPDALETPEQSSFGSDLAFWHSDVIVADMTFSGSTLNSGAVVTYSHVERATLAASPLHVSLITGGAQELALDAGVEHAGRPFILAGSLGGSSPGFFFGSHHIPLQRERLYYPLSRQIGVLDGNGRAERSVRVPPLPPDFAHATLHHVYVLLDARLGLVHTSNVALGALNYRLIP